MDNDISEDHVCSICLGLFENPVSPQTCQHIFCLDCITRLKGGQGIKLCPLCRKEFPQNELKKEEELQNTLRILYPEKIREREKMLEKESIRLIIGNTSRKVDVGPHNRYQNYEWVFYVRVDEGQPPLRHFAERVEVKLHPTFEPQVLNFGANQEIVFRARGYGTFGIQVRIFWIEKYGGFSSLRHSLQFVPHKYAIHECKL